MFTVEEEECLSCVDDVIVDVRFVDDVKILLSFKCSSLDNSLS